MPRKANKKTSGNASAPTAVSPRKNTRGRKFSAAIKWVALFFFVVVIIAVINFGLFNTENTLIKSGVSIGPINAAGKTTGQVASELRDYLSGYRLTFITSQGTETIDPLEETDRPIVEFQIDTAVGTAHDIGRNKNFFLTLAERLGASLLGASVPVPFTLNEQNLLAELEERFGSLIDPAKNASLKISVDEDDEFTIQVLPEKSGRSFDTPSLIEETRSRLRNLSSVAVSVDISTDEPELTETKLTPLVARAGEILRRAPQAVTAESLSWTINRHDLANWIIPQADDNGAWTLTLDTEQLTQHLETQSSSISVEPRNAEFELNEETKRVVRFVPAFNGEKLDVTASIDLLKQKFLTDDENSVSTAVNLPVAVAEPEITNEIASQPYGIKKLIGVGATNFRGSPANRRHNIANGAKSLDGILVPPGEEFSLVGALGPIDGEHGYLEELVIKQNETKPEYGGGLCQIGTTAFRTVLNAGLPVTERRNHSYRVSYYERDGEGNYIGPGKDATIYDPWPDFKFKNDTTAHILIRTSIEGDRVTFNFWGIDDGRTATQSDVSIWNVNDPPPKKEVYTTNLAPGTWRCTETPHASASTVFTYTVTYPNGEAKEEKFYSYYKPWQEVCLVGVTAEELAQKNAEAEAGASPETNDAAETPDDNPTPEDVPADNSGMEEAEG
ncbi:MAG: VanW family protein [Patescibacteria group bacterium]